MDEKFDVGNETSPQKLATTVTTRTTKAKSRAKSRVSTMPETGYVRLSQIIGHPGDLNSNPPMPPTPAVIPVGKSTWWAGVRSGIYPKPIKISKRCTAWNVHDIRKLAGVK